MREFILGSYDWEGSGVGDQSDWLRRQLCLLADVRASAWVFQGCAGWRDSGGETFFLAEHILGLRGFLAASIPRGGDLAVFVRGSAGLRVTAHWQEMRYSFWHAPVRVVVATPWPGILLQLVSVHLAPTSPAIRLAEAEALAAIADDDPVIAGGSWNALSATDPEPSLCESGSGYRRRVADRTAANALEEAGFVDVGAYLRDIRPTVGHNGSLLYRCDRKMEPAPGPLTTRSSTSPPGSGATQPSGPPTLSIVPSLIGESSKVISGGIRKPLT